MAELCYNTLNEGNRLKTQMHNVLLQVLEIEPFNLFWANLRGSDVTVALAFRSGSWKPDPISAVVVNGVLLANPPESPVLSSIKILELPLIPPTLALCLTELGIH